MILFEALPGTTNYPSFPIKPYPFIPQQLPLLPIIQPFLPFPTPTPMKSSQPTTTSENSMTRNMRRKGIVPQHSPNSSGRRREMFRNDSVGGVFARRDLT